MDMLISVFSSAKWHFLILLSDIFKIKLVPNLYLKLLSCGEKGY